MIIKIYCEYLEKASKSFIQSFYSKEFNIPYNIEQFVAIIKCILLFPWLPKFCITLLSLRSKVPMEGIMLKYFVLF